jgi:hypothetical protein
MNTPERSTKGPGLPLGPKSKHQSTHRKYRDFTIYRIAKLIHTYNHTKHDTTHRIPWDVDQRDPHHEWEEGWIIKKLYETEERKRLSDYELEVGDMVRFILPKQNETGTIIKKRYSLTPESFKITKQKGYAYVITAQNGDRLTVPRWRLKLCSVHEEALHPWALEFPRLPQAMEPKTRPHREDAHPENIYRDQPGPQDGRTPDQIRDKFLRDWFDKRHKEGDALIPPSEGREIIGGRPSVIGSRDFREGDHRLFIPILTTGHGHELWVLIVIQFKDGVARPRFYSPETNPQDGIPNRWPAWKADLEDYIRSLVPHARVQWDEDHLFIHGLARPGPRDHKARSFFYIADYAARFLFRGSEPPRENNAQRPPITIPKELLKDLKRLLPTGEARIPPRPPRVARWIGPPS